MKETQRATARQERQEVDYEFDVVTDSVYLLRRCHILIFQHGCFFMFQLTLNMSLLVCTFMYRFMVHCLSESLPKK